MVATANGAGGRALAPSKGRNMARQAPLPDPAIGDGSSKRRNRARDVTRAAVRVFYEKGYAASSVQDVADVVGVLKGSLYYYIDSKEDLLFRIVDNVHGQSSEILDDVRALDVAAIDRVQRYVERHVKWYLDNVEEVTVFFREWRYLTGERLEIAEKRRRGYERAIRHLIVAAQDEGAIDPAVDPKYASFFVLAAVNNVPEWSGRGASDSATRIAATYADLTVGTLVGTRPRARKARR
jgi:TetR/AcrR family transcriptional regulator, cholesterol catabolism regulator